MYIAPGQGQTTLWGQNFDVNRNSLSLCPYVDIMTTERPFLFALMLQVSKSDFIHIFNDFIHVYSPGARAENPFDVNRNPYHFDHLLQVSNKSLLILILYTFLMFFHMYIAQRQGQTILCGQNSDVNRKALSLCPFVASFKKNFFEVWFYT